ncbi:MAG: M1 family aminopeptidase [Actinomycetota bacterium]|jgi:puromycin-sensitive aminopeptidase|nr:M1 family aminopeptidase [Actinomycetota bacterium]
MTPTDGAPRPDRLGDDASYRLPRSVAPRRYELHLVPDLHAARFSGRERIEVEILEPCAAIECHAVGLEVSDASLETGWTLASEAVGSRQALSISLDPERERIRFQPSAPLAPGRYRLSCAFAGVLNDRLRGFYRSTFAGEDGQQMVIAATQFEETAARQAFPCFDEPDRKAVFSITLDAPPGTVALSNGAEVSSELLEGGGRRVRFGDTIVMSTYLVAFIVGPLEATEAVDADGVPLRVAFPPGRSGLTRPALEAGRHALGFFSSYFDLPYPGDKLDLVALPDFAAGAMENLGCVTFREAILLAEESNTSQPELERLAEVVAHELAHMWFGDLVTMGWWNGIWLNEAFATFMALCCEDDYRPAWRVFAGFARGRSNALGIDALHATRPIEYPVKQPEDAAAMFDVLTYEKGASVLWMVEQFLGRDRFQAGVRAYLRQHAYANTKTTDLWDALDAVAPEVPVGKVMETWLLQGGHPLVRARLVDGPDGEQVELTQEPFSYLPASVAAEIGTAPPEGSAIGSGWLVPLIAAPAGTPAAAGRAPEGVHKVLLGKDAIRLPAPTGGALVVNAGGTGFFRTSYDDTLQARVLARFAALGPIEQFNLVSDAWATTLAGRAEVSRFVMVLRHLNESDDPYVWSLALNALVVLDLVAEESERPALSRAAHELLSERFATIGWERAGREDDKVPLLRSTLVSGLGTLGRDDTTIARAHELFAGDHFGGTALDPDLAAAVLGVVSAHASHEEFTAILGRYRRPRDPMDGIRHLYSLARLRDADRVAQVLELCLSEIRSQNAPILLGAMLMNRESGSQTFAFIKEHFAAMTARYPDNLIPRMLEGVAGLAQLETDGEPRFVHEVREFCAGAVKGASRRRVNQSLERLEVHVRLAARLRGQLARALGSTGG